MPLPGRWYGPGVPEEISRSEHPHGPWVHAAANRDTMAAVRFRTAAIAAFAAGFAIGSLRSRRTTLRVVAADGSIPRARAGRPSTRVTPEKVRAVLVLSTVRVRDAVGVRLGWRDGEEATDAIVVEMTGDLATALKGRRPLAV